MRGLAYDSIILSILVYWLYKESGYANIALIFDAGYKMFLLTLYHFKESPLERIGNYFLSFFTNLKTFDIMSMFKSNFEILREHRSVISMFCYLGMLIGYFYMFGHGFKLPQFDQIKEKIQQTMSQVGHAAQGQGQGQGKDRAFQQASPNVSTTKINQDTRDTRH
jgi:hypothetical protein